MANTMNMNIKNVSFFDVLPVKMNKAASAAKRTAAMMNMNVTDVFEYFFERAIFVELSGSLLVFITTDFMSKGTQNMHY